MTPTDDEESAEAQEVWNELQGTRDPRSREDLLVRLAEYALSNHDFSDLETPEDIHDAICEMRVCEAHYQVAALRVGRLVAQYMELEQGMVIIPLGAEENPN